MADAVSPLSWDIVEAMSTVKELVLSPGGIAFEALPAALDEDAALDEEAAGDDVDDVDDDEQPAATTATAAARAAQPSRGRGLTGPWPCGREGRPPCCLFPSAISYPFRRNALGYARCGTPHDTCVPTR